MRWFQFLGVDKGVKDVETDSDADGAVGHVERGPGEFSKAEVEKIDDVAVSDAVDQIADNAPAKESEADLARCGAQAELMTQFVNEGQRDHREQGEPVTHPLEYSPGGSGVPPMDNIKKAGNDGDAIELEINRQVDPDLGNLIEKKYGARKCVQRLVPAHPVDDAAGGHRKQVATEFHSRHKDGRQSARRTSLIQGPVVNRTVTKRVKLNLIVGIVG